MHAAKIDDDQRWFRGWFRSKDEDDVIRTSDE